jgi:4-amino-4-deoxy-L-arabinose transferase-like glycosyltransferase
VTVTATREVRSSASRSSFRVALAIVTAAAIVRLVLAAVIPPPPDETYYWEWSRHLAAGYFDHPPLIALAVRAGTALFGTTPLGLRLVPVLFGWGATLCAVLLARRLGDGDAGVRAAAIVACMPLAAAGLILATPDAPLLFFVAATLLALDHAVSAPPGGKRATLWWLVAGVALGGALLSKYNAALVPAAVLLAFLVVPSLRRQLATPGPWLAVLLALVLFLPALAWNARHGWVSFRFQSAHGLGRSGGSPVERELSLLAGQLALVSPVLLVLFAAVAVRALRAGAPRERLLAVVASVIFLFFCASALRAPAEANWQAPAYAAAIVLAAVLGGTGAWERWLGIGCAVGAVMVLATYVQAVHPMLPVAASDDPTARGAGWHALARQVGAVADSVHAATGARVWIAGDRYQEASEIAFHLPDHPPVLSLNLGSRANQYDVWPGFPARARAGDALVLVIPPETRGRPDRVVTLLRPYFRHVAFVAPADLLRGGELRDVRRVWVLDGWTGGWPR